MPNELWIRTTASGVPVGGKLRLRGTGHHWKCERQEPTETIIRRGVTVQRLTRDYPVTMPISQDPRLR